MGDFIVRPALAQFAAKEQGGQWGWLRAGSKKGVRVTEKKVVVFSGFMNEANKAKVRETFEPAGYEIVFCQTEAEVLENAAGAEIVYANGAGNGNQVAQRAGAGLKWFCSFTAGVDAMLQPGVLPAGCHLTNGAGAFGLTIAEHLVMVTLMLLRRYPEYNEMVRRHEWDHSLGLRSIYGSRITILGTGDIGTRFAERIRAFGPAKVVGLNRSGMKKSEAYDEVAAIQQLEAYLPETDILVMCLPGTAETKHILNEARLAMLPETAYVVNVGRGSAIQQEAIAKALNEGRLAGAALDVLEVEPLPPEDSLWDTKNLIITPHNSGQLTLAYTRDKNVDMFCSNLQPYLAGESMAFSVDVLLGY